MGTAAKENGLVLTPATIARELVGWAVTKPTDTVLDVGSGKGIFLLEAAGRLRALGCSEKQIAAQLYGVERDPELYQCASATLKKELGFHLPGFVHGDFFQAQFPSVSAIVGNPPYVRRNSLWDVDKIRARLVHEDLFLANLPRLTDLYTYFIMHASGFLAQGGRMAVVTSGSWMDTNYGIALKRYLLRNFTIHMAAMCEQRFFPDALVKPVMLLAEKASAGGTAKARFLRMRRFVPGFSQLDAGRLEEVGTVAVVMHRDLDEREPWGVFVREPGAYFSLPVEKCVSLGRLAKSRIGIQPLASAFYILPADAASARGIPEEYLQPLAHSPRCIPGRVIKDADALPHRILFVSQPLSRIRSRPVVEHIRHGESREVEIRGKGSKVIGFNNLPRLQLTGRHPWYNLVDEIRRRGRYSILLPRRFYDTFVVVWNKAGAVAGENFIELEPVDPRDTTVLLALLNSSFFELACRSRGQQYGGGVYNLNPLDVRELPVLNPLLLAAGQRAALERAYGSFLEDGSRDRLDTAVAGAFELGSPAQGRARRAVAELRRLAVVSKAVSAV